MQFDAMRRVVCLFVGHDNDHVLVGLPEYMHEHGQKRRKIQQHHRVIIKNIQKVTKSYKKLARVSKKLARVS